MHHLFSAHLQATGCGVWYHRPRVRESLAVHLRRALHAPSRKWSFVKPLCGPNRILRSAIHQNPEGSHIDEATTTLAEVKEPHCRLFLKEYTRRPPPKVHRFAP